MGQENERRLVAHIKKLCAAGFAPDRKTVQALAFNFAEKLKVKHRFSLQNAKAGKQWLRSFLERNPDLSIRQSEGLSLARAQGMNRLEVANFFELLANVLTENNLINRPSNIFNMDEAGIQIINKPSKVIAPKGAKDVHTLTSRERGENITVIGCCSAEGAILPPVLIMKGVNRKPEFSDGLPTGSAVYMNKKSSFINSYLFLKWLTEQFIPRKPPGKTLLIMDGHSSHCSDVEMLEIADRNEIILLCLPSHCTQALQPLDRSFFGPLKTYWNQEAKTWMTNHPNRNLMRYQAGEVLGKAWVRAATAANAISGFRGTGIFPLDQNAIPDHFYSISDLARQNAENGNSNATSQEKTLARIEATTLDKENSSSRTASSPTNVSHDSFEHQPSTSGYHSDKADITPSKFLQEIRPIPKIPLSLNKRKKSATLLTSPENITTKKSKQLPEKNKKQKVANSKKNRKKGKEIKKVRSPKSSSGEESDEESLASLRRKLSNPPPDSCQNDSLSNNKSTDANCYCVECYENYNLTQKSVDWICCIKCNNWLHETCTLYVNMCNICKRREFKEKKESE